MIVLVSLLVLLRELLVSIIFHVVHPYIMPTAKIRSCFNLGVVVSVEITVIVVVCRE